MQFLYKTIKSVSKTLLGVLNMVDQGMIIFQTLAFLIKYQPNINWGGSFKHPRDFIDWWGPPGVSGILGEWLFIFRELGSTGNYFKVAREHAYKFGDIGSLAKKQKKINKEKPPFCLIFLKFLLLLGG